MRHHSLLRSVRDPIVAILCVMPAPLAAQVTLGSIDFPTSGSAAAQEHFIEGVLFLHSFEYATAAEAFREAQQLDPDFAMAYWGEAMTYTHAVWSEKDVTAARAALGRLGATREARAAKAPTDREKGYLAAVEILYGDGPKEPLDTLYSEAMGRLSDAHPDDLEAKAFYALSLIGLSRGDRNIPTYMRAAALAQEVFDQNRDHPGAAHYLIHSFDDPIHGPLGLTAARAYTTIAPGAAHAQHMTSHIFVAVGMWNDVVAANITATSVSAQAAAARGTPRTYCGHYNEWLHYGYLQQGRYGDAEELLGRCHQETSGAASYAFMRAANLIDTQDWGGSVAAATLAGNDAPARTRILMAFATAYSAVQRGEMTDAEARIAEFDALLADIPSEALGQLAVARGVLRGLVLHANGHGENAVAELERTVEIESGLPFAFGPPRVAKPPRELLGEVLLAEGRAEEAVSAFELALARTPRRARAMLGLARAAAATHRTDKATTAYADFLKASHRADAGLPEIAEAREYLSAHAGTR
ncbi:MAG: hypothetical protein O7I93_14420 [Gemmatimonadetes bacterium]|nr:hypothetical protein [Gemmatimonadota bacterium]